jgi:hypothetical protein
MLAQELIADIATQYRVSPTLVLYEVDKALQTDAFKQAIGYNYGCVTEDGIQLHRIGGTVMLPQLKRSLCRMLKHHVLEALNFQSALNEYEYWRHIQHKTVIGHVERKEQNGTLVIALGKDSFGYTENTIYARCHLCDLPPKERNSCRPGESKIFYASKVAIKKSPNGVYMVDISLSRTIKRLPEILLRQKLEDCLKRDIKVRVKKRHCGELTIIETSASIPSRFITELTSELNERIRIEITSDRKKSRRKTTR